MWHEFSMVVGTFQLLNAGLAAVRNYKAILKNLKDGVMAVKNTLTAVAFSAMMRFMKLDEELLTLTETILTTRDMKWLNRLLDDLEKEKTVRRGGGAERYNNIKKAAEDRLAVLDGEAQLEQKLAKERKAADELEDADADAGARGEKNENVTETTTYEPRGPLKGKKVGHTFSKHGSHNTHELQLQAKNSGMAQGQWIDDSAAEIFITNNLDKVKNGAVTIELPEGLGRVVNPDGTFTPATHVRLVPNGSGVKTAYPKIGAE